MKSNERLFITDWLEFLDIKRRNKRLFRRAFDWKREKHYKWGGWLSPILLEAQNRFIAEKFLPHLSKESVVLDMGCASGDFAFSIADKVKEIHGYDISKRMISRARRIAKKKRGGGELRFYAQDATKAKFLVNFDCAAILGATLYIFDDREVLSLLKNIARHMKKGGMLVAVDSLASGADTIYLYRPLDSYSACYRNEGDYFRMFDKAGFELVESDVITQKQEPLMDSRQVRSLALFRKK